MQDTEKLALPLNETIERKDGTLFGAFAGWHKTDEGERQFREFGLKLSDKPVPAPIQVEPQPDAGEQQPARFNGNLPHWIQQLDFNRQGKKFVEDLKENPNPENEVMQNARGVINWISGFDLKEETVADLLPPLTEIMSFVKTPSYRGALLRQLTTALNDILENDVKISCLEYPWLQMLVEIWLDEQKPTPSEVLPGKPEDTIAEPVRTGSRKVSDKELREKVVEILAPLGGLSPQKRPIMKKGDFDRLLEFSTKLALSDALPPEGISPISQTGISNEHIRFTFYRLHKALFGTRRIRPNFITFLHLVFSQFAGTASPTTRSKFSSAPQSYEKDFAGYIGEIA